jgi:putative transcriptional regulator
MNSWEAEYANSLGMTLKEAGFEVSRMCCSRPSCFDFAAKKGEKIILLKIHSDVDSFSRADSRELRVIAGRIQTATLVISKTAHDNPLEDDTVYSRYEICVVTEKTFKNVGLEGTEPLINAGPGGYFVRIDGSLIERRRKEIGLSIGRLAEMIGVSRRTLYGYERSMAKASVTSAYNLANVLGIPVAKPVDLFEKTRKQRECLLMKAKRAIARQALLLKVFRKFASCDISPVERAPFDFILNVPDEKCVIVGAIAENSEKSIDDRAEEILSVCQVVNAHPVLISEKSEVCPSKDILCISFDALADIQSPNDLIGSA